MPRLEPGAIRLADQAPAHVLRPMFGRRPVPRRARLLVGGKELRVSRGQYRLIDLLVALWAFEPVGKSRVPNHSDVLLAGRPEQVKAVCRQEGWLLRALGKVFKRFEADRAIHHRRPATARPALVVVFRHPRLLVDPHGLGPKVGPLEGWELGHKPGNRAKVAVLRVQLHPVLVADLEAVCRILLVRLDPVPQRAGVVDRVLALPVRLQLFGSPVAGRVLEHTLLVPVETKGGALLPARPVRHVVVERQWLASAVGVELVCFRFRELVKLARGRRHGCGTE